MRTFSFANPCSVRTSRWTAGLLAVALAPAASAQTPAPSDKPTDAQMEVMRQLEEMYARDGRGPMPSLRLKDAPNTQMPAGLIAVPTTPAGSASYKSPTPPTVNGPATRMTAPKATPTEIPTFRPTDTPTAAPAVTANVQPIASMDQPLQQPSAMGDSYDSYPNSGVQLVADRERRGIFGWMRRDESQQAAPNQSDNRLFPRFRPFRRDEEPQQPAPSRPTQSRPTQPRPAASNNAPPAPPAAPHRTAAAPRQQTRPAAPVPSRSTTGQSEVPTFVPPPVPPAASVSQPTNRRQGNPFSETDASQFYGTAPGTSHPLAEPKSRTAEPPVPQPTEDPADAPFTAPVNTPFDDPFSTVRQETDARAEPAGENPFADAPMTDEPSPTKPATSDSGPAQVPAAIAKDAVQDTARDDESAVSNGGNAGEARYSELQRKLAERAGMGGFQGFCPVALHDDRALVDARSEFLAVYEGRSYQLSSAQARARFEADPTRYAPVNGGEDVVLASRGEKETAGNLHHAAWYKGRLYMFRSDETLREFDAHPLKYAVGE